MVSQALRYVILGLTLSLMATTARAQTVVNFSTGFEAPTYSTTGTVSVPLPSSLGGGSFTTAPGNLFYANTQPGPQSWGALYSGTGATAASVANAVNSLTIQSNIVRSGSQALLVDGAVANQSIFGATARPALPTGPIVTWDFDMQVSNASIFAGQWGLGIVDMNGNNIVSAGFYGGLLVAASDPTRIYGGIPSEFTPVSYNTWNRYSVTVNFISKSFSVALNGIVPSAFADLPLRSDVSLGEIDVYSFGGQTPAGAPYSSTPERAYFDNVVRSTTAPEPGTLVFIALGSSLVVLRRKRTA